MASSSSSSSNPHPRLLLPSFLPLDLCKELEFIHKSCSTVGYRPAVFSTTLSHLIATNCLHLLLPFVPIREKLKEVVEEFFDCHYEVVVEFTGLVSWCRGASIGWHSDDNRPYLKQRDFTAVCYLNDHGMDFEGGVLRFKDGETACVVPKAGDVVIYTADGRNIHSVDEVTCGERITLTLWFSRDSFHNEDPKLISLLSEKLSNHQDEYHKYYLPSPASSNMYWYTEQSGFDIRSARMHALGCSFCAPVIKAHPSIDSRDDPFEGPVKVCIGDKVHGKEFANSMHALQVVHFYNWKASALAATITECSDRFVNPLNLGTESDVESVIQYSDTPVPGTIFSTKHVKEKLASMNCIEFSLATAEWDNYVSKMNELLQASISHWKAHQTLFSCTFC